MTETSTVPREIGSARFHRFCWGALAFVVGVILWGALVRATGSGAGCGSHWPTCNGEVLPTPKSTKTLIELTHRVTSGLSALVVLAEVVLAFRLFDRGHRVRKAATWSGVFMVIEVLIGAGIVLLAYVDQNKSVARAVWMAVHLVNTFLLVGAMTLTAHFAGGGEPFEIRKRGTPALLAILSVVGTLVVGMSGAVAALGDTLFPAKDLGTALAQDLSPAAHFLVRLRIIHPFAAVAVAFLVLGVRFLLALRHDEDPLVRRWGNLLRTAVIVQMAAGMANLVLLAPTWMQLVHLLLAQALWIALVLFLAVALAAEDHPAPESLGEVDPEEAPATS
ncbi:MAG: COX15/CtaA family protein [Polyangiaceae bacterium]